MHRLKAIHPMSLAKISGVIHGVLGLLVVPFALLMAFGASFAPHKAGAPSGAVVAALLVVLAFLLPVLYGAIGFVTGGLAAVLYNFFAARVGGIEMEMEFHPLMPGMQP